MTPERIQAILDQVDAIRAEIEEAVKAGPETSIRREALAMATGWMPYVRANLKRALECE
jgi:hypothetical protein